MILASFFLFPNAARSFFINPIFPTRGLRSTSHSIGRRSRLRKERGREKGERGTGEREEKTKGEGGGRREEEDREEKEEEEEPLLSLGSVGCFRLTFIPENKKS